MNPTPNDVTQLLSNPDVLRLLQDKEALRALGQSPEVKKLMATLSQKSGGRLEDVAAEAMQGNTERLSQLMKDVTQNPESAKTISDLKQRIAP